MNMSMDMDMKQRNESELIQKNRSILIRVSRDELEKIRFLCKRNKLQKATLIQMYLNHALEAFEKEIHGGIFIGFNETNGTKKDQEIVIRVEETTHKILARYADRTALTKPNIVRFLVIPKIITEYQEVSE